MGFVCSFSEPFELTLRCWTGLIQMNDGMHFRKAKVGLNTALLPNELTIWMLDDQMDFWHKLTFFHFP